MDIETVVKLFFFPALLMVSGIIITYGFVIVLFLLALGISGIVMNSLQKKADPQVKLIMPWCNIVLVVISAVIGMLPVLSCLYFILSFLY